MKETDYPDYSYTKMAMHAPDEPEDCEHMKLKLKDYHFDNYEGFSVIFKCTKCGSTTTATIDLDELTDWEEE